MTTVTSLHDLPGDRARRRTVRGLLARVWVLLAAPVASRPPSLDAAVRTAADVAGRASRGPADSVALSLLERTTLERW